MPFGIGTIKFVYNAHLNTSSTSMEDVSRLVIIVLVTIFRVTVSLASRDTTWSMVDANCRLSILLDRLILDVEPGIGTTRDALPAPKDTLSTLIDVVFLSTISVQLMMLTAAV